MLDLLVTSETDIPLLSIVSQCCLALCIKITRDHDRFEHELSTITARTMKLLVH